MASASASSRPDPGLPVDPGSEQPVPSTEDVLAELDPSTPIVVGVGQAAEKLDDPDYTALGGQTSRHVPCVLPSPTSESPPTRWPP